MKNKPDIIEKKKQSRTCLSCAFSFILLGESYMYCENSTISTLFSRVSWNWFFLNSERHKKLKLIVSSFADFISDHQNLTLSYLKRLLFWISTSWELNESLTDSLPCDDNVQICCITSHLIVCFGCHKFNCLDFHFIEIFSLVNIFMFKSNTQLLLRSLRNLFIQL